MPPRLPRPAAPSAPAGVSIDLSAAVAAVTQDEPRVLSVRGGERPALPSGPLESDHRTLEAGLRSWVEKQTNQTLNYVEQLYTFGDLDRQDDGARALSVAYLALVREARPAGEIEASWLDWYSCFPWEDWRAGRPAILDTIEAGLDAWAGRAGHATAADIRRERRRLAFGSGGAWNDERVLERYELLYEAGLVQEAADTVADGGTAPPLGRAMAFDHRRILATAIGRLRGKIKYRPVVFELMPPAFTLLQLQRAVEALSGMRLHKQNFRRLVETQGLVEETGETATETGGRPARLVRFRREVLLERPAPGVRPAAPRR
ncbi:NUDIX hydrolase [Aquabacter cavernae]|uniref:NUDIX hydrolase n=1 Tax=Aquabacter cavernae TaxID=2496029 RepID=UPI000F8DC949|nr:hypothetical protein [Aquabacter cavernae]